MEPLLSIIIPTYNCEGFVREGIESVLCQMPEDYELIIVDDGSGDGTARILASYEGLRSDLHVIFCEHKGASAARNTGLGIATGRYVTFMDCDDCIRDGFFEKSRPLLDKGADLYIFGIERIPLEGNNEFWTVRDRYYETVSDFADEYIRTRQLLVYSNCNKFYRRSIIDKMDLRFKENVSFGEDRLFNYDFLSGCGAVVTSSLIMLRYIQRSIQSMSSDHVADYFDKVMKLHEAKMKCFLPLSKNTSREEKLDFEAYDLTGEISRTIRRFTDHPEEIKENLPKINKIAFGECDDPDTPIDSLIILGSRNCEYKVEQAIKIFGAQKDLNYIVSGGNLHLNGIQTEAEFMAAYLQEHGVDKSRIHLENRAKYTKQNLEFSEGVIHELGSSKIGILTEGFHIPRTRYLADQIRIFAENEVYWFPAYGPVTHVDTWFEDPNGLEIVLVEIRKTLILSSHYV